MKTLPAQSAVPAAPSPSAPAPTAASPGAPRFVRGVKIHQPIVASNRDFIRAWAARRAKLTRTPRAPRA